MSTANSKLTYLGFLTTETDTGQTDRYLARLTFTNATTITATISNTVGAGDTLTIGYEVVERWP